MIRAINFPDPSLMRLRRLPGSFHLSFDPRGNVQSMTFICPCGCKAPVRIEIGLRQKPAESPSWSWNGSLTEPTLSPSVNRLDCGWHGWLRDGYWTEVSP